MGNLWDAKPFSRSGTPPRAEELDSQSNCPLAICDGLQQCHWARDELWHRAVLETASTEREGHDYSP